MWEANSQVCSFWRESTAANEKVDSVADATVDSGDSN